MVVFPVALTPQTSPSVVLGGHTARFDAQGHLLPWIAWNEQGRPRDLFKRNDLGGWQEDAHTDVVHNYVDALRAFPEWSSTK